MLPPDDAPHEPYNVPRGTCASCGSVEVVHLIIGVRSGPDVMDGDPDWVQWVGSIHPGYNRECRSCGATWNSRAVEPPGPIRLLSDAGASFALLPAPNLMNLDYPYTQLVDIELLTPDRLVRYLGRPLSLDSLTRLAEAWLQAAQDEYPEQTVPTVKDDGAGLAVSVDQSTPFAVTLEILVEADQSDDIPDQDGVAFDVQRSGLIDAAHAIAGWLQ